MSDDRESRIRQKAYEIWEQLGRPEGQEQDHWIRAEAELQVDETEGTADVPEGAEDLGPKIASNRG
jgi:hypothetical protein